MIPNETFESALNSQDPIESLRVLALDLAARGHGRQEIYDIFLIFYKQLQESGRWIEEQVLGDVMDMISGSFPPFNLDLPK